MPRTTSLAELEAQLVELVEGITIVALRRLGNIEQARDAAQETIARFLERVRNGSHRADVPLERAVYAIARNVIVDMLRERGRTSELDSSLHVDTPDALALLIGAEEQSAVDAALARLSEADRDILRRCFVDGERVAEIAARTHEPAERIRKRKSRALRRLAELLGITPKDGHVLPASPMKKR